MKKIEKKTIDSSGFQKEGILIDVEGDEWEDTIDKSEDIIEEYPSDPKQIIDKIGKAGICRIRWRNFFQTHVKLMPPQGMNKAETLIINGVECEPYLTADHRIMLEKSKEIIIGIRILMTALGVKKSLYRY